MLLDTADSVMDTKKKLEFGVQQIIFKVVKLNLCQVTMLKSGFSEIRDRTRFHVVSPAKKHATDWLTYLIFINNPQGLFYLKKKFCLGIFKGKGLLEVP